MQKKISIEDITKKLNGKNLESEDNSYLENTSVKQKLESIKKIDRVKYSVGIKFPKTKKKINIKFYLF